jgi:hypothetical protein
MAIKTLWLVKHNCGDDEAHDLSGKRPSERAGYARWLRGKDCSVCWRRIRGRDREIEYGTWLAERHREEARVAS